MRRPGDPCRDMATAAAVQNSPRTTRNLSPSVSNPRGQTVRFFHPLQTLPYNSPRDLPRDPGAHRVSGGSVGAGLAGGRFSLLGDEPPSPGLAAADGGNAEATERGKQPGGARTSRHLFIYRKARPRAPLPELPPKSRERSLTMARRESERGSKETWPTKTPSPRPPSAVRPGMRDLHSPARGEGTMRLAPRPLGRRTTFR